MFVPFPLLGVAGLVFLVLLVLAVRPRGRRDDLMGAPRLAARPLSSVASSVGLAPELEAQVWEQLRGGNVIVAIKMVREATGLGLKEAKDLVDGMRQSGPPVR